jgi:hypothetical protein
VNPRGQLSIACVPRIAGADSGEALAKKWEEGYRQCLEVVRRYREHCGEAKGGNVKKWLLREIDRRPLRQFAFVSDWINGIPDEEWDERHAVRALFWMVQDCRNAYLQSGCPQAQPESGVPIARLWVHMPSAGATKAKCRVIAIDAQPPYRRYMQGDAWPAPMGYINAGRVIWRRLNEAQGMLISMGIRPGEATRFAMPHSAGALEEELHKGKTMISLESVGRLQFLDCGDLGYRVIGVLE